MKKNEFQIFINLFILFLLIPRVSAQEIFPEIPNVEKDNIEKIQPFPKFEFINPLKLPSGIDQKALGDQLITIKEIIFEGNQIITDEEIQSILLPFYGKTMPASELNVIEEVVNDLYAEKGYLSSGAVIVGNDDVFDLSNTTIQLQIVETMISSLEVLGDQSIKPLVKRSLSKHLKRPLNQNKLDNELRFLLDQEIIDALKVKFKDTGFINETKLQVNVESGEKIDLIGIINNQRSPSSGSFERGLSFTHKSLSGVGDNLTLDYRNTDGSNLAVITYDFPINKNHGLMGFRYLYSNAEVVEEPLDELQLESEVNQYQLSYRQPIVRKSTDRKLDELGIGATIKRIDSREFQQGVPSRLSIGSNNNGEYRSTVVSLLQYFSRKTPKENLFIDSSLNIGTPIGSTNDSFFGDGSFLKFNLNAEYLRKVTNRIGTLTTVQGQITGQTLPNIEQFSIGGSRSVRGFDSSIIDGDSGITINQEMQFSIFDTRQHNVEIAPFFDFGVVSRNSEPIFSQDKMLASLGVVLRYRFFNRLLTSLEYGQPIIGDNQSRSRFTFSIIGKIF